MNKFIGFYYSWFAGLFDNVKGVTGYVIRSEWLPQDKIIIKNNFSANISTNASKNYSGNYSK